MEKLLNFTKKIITLSIIIFYFAPKLNAQQSRQKNEVGVLKIHKELSSKKLSEAQLIAYTKRAKQKAQDAFNYVEIALQQDYIVSQKKQALKQLSTLFVGIPSWANSLENLENYWGKNVKFTPQNSTIFQDLKWTQQGFYKGIIELEYVVKSEKKKEQNTQKISFIVSKNTKRVGSEEVEVWEILLEAF